MFFFYIHQKNHIVYLLLHIHDFLLINKYFLGILFLILKEVILFLMIVFLCQRNLLKKDNLILEDILHIQINEEDHNIDHEYHHIFLLESLILLKLAEIKISLLLLYITNEFLSLLMLLVYLAYNYFFFFFFKVKFFYYIKMLLYI